MGENKEMVVADQNQGALFMGEQQKIFCSVVADTEEEKKALFNALEECDALLNDLVGQEITIKNVYCEEKQVLDETTGELKTKYRTILFDVKGKTYATGSYGIFNVIKKLCSIYGMPTWEKGIKVKVAQRPINNNKKTLTLSLV